MSFAVAEKLEHQHQPEQVNTLAAFDQQLVQMEQFFAETLKLAPLVDRLDDWFPATTNQPIITEQMIKDGPWSRSEKLLLRRKFRAYTRNFYGQIFATLESGGAISTVETVENQINLKRPNLTTNTLALANSYGGFVFFDLNNPIHAELEAEISPSELSRIRDTELSKFEPLAPEYNPMQSYLKEQLGDELFKAYAGSVFQARVISSAKKALGARYESIELMPSYVLVTKEEVKNIIEILKFTQLSIASYRASRGGDVDPSMVLSPEELVGYAKRIVENRPSVHPELDTRKEQLILYMGQSGYQKYLEVLEAKKV